MPDSRFASGSNALWRAVRVLVVDDEPMILRTVQRMLRRRRPDWKLVTVTSGESALEQLEQRPFDVMVTDLHMHGMQGRTLLRLVRARYPELVCVVHSAGADALPRQVYAELAQGFVAKPSGGDTLLRTIEAALGFEADCDDEQHSA